MTNLEAEVQVLRTQMKKDQLCPEEPIIADNLRHTFFVHKSGKDDEAFYVAMPYPGGFISPILSCTYGLLNESLQYSYTSPEREKI